jgi:ketosteroid isomerase-like protein
MDSLRTLFISPIVVLTLFLVSMPGLRADNKDDRAIQALVDKFQQAANSTDVTRVQRLLSEISQPGGPFYTPFGNIIRSAKDLEAEIEMELEDLDSRNFSVTTPVSIQRDGKMAWTNYSWRTDLIHTDGSQDTLQGRDTLVFAKIGKNWKLRHMHSSIPASPPITQLSIQMDAQAVLDQEQAIWTAFKDQQIDTLGPKLEENYSALQDGQAYRIRGKNTFLSSATDQWAQNELRSFQILDPKLAILGDTALLTYYYLSSGFSDNVPFSNSGKATSVYIRKDGQWLALHSHQTLNKNTSTTLRERAVD